MSKHLTYVLVAISFVVFCIAFSSPAGAAETWEVIAKASPDECFFGVGSDENQYPMTDLCEPPGQPKTNEAYVWGLTKFGNNIFFGTGPNIHCLVIQGYLGQTDPILTDDYVCEASANPPFGDMRPPGLYMYNEESGLVRLNNPVAVANQAAALLLQTTLGIRSAGSNDGVAFLAGPSSNGVNMFAFDAETGAFLGAMNFEGFSNVRKWLVASDGELYVGLGGGEAGVGGGALWRWIGSKDDLNTLFDFEEVGTGLDGDAAELTEHDGRIFVSTWPGGGGNAGIWMSPLLAELIPANKENWTKLWSSTDYDPDPVTAATYGGSNLQAYLVDPSWEGSPFDPSAPRSWQSVPNKMGLVPLYGLAGFGNIFNNYTWIMQVWNNALYVGTMDHSYLLLGGIAGPDLPSELQPFLDGIVFGADLYRFDDATSSAVAVSLDGMGNPMNDGIRTALASNPMYLGTANPMNLNPDGGWELIKVTDPSESAAGSGGGDGGSIGCFINILAK